MKQPWTRRLLKWLLYQQWKRTLTYGDRVRLDYWGATGNPKHHPFAWADDLVDPSRGEKEK